MISPDGSVAALTIGRIALTSDSAMPVSCGPFPPHKKLSQSTNGPALAVPAAPSTAASAAANTSVFMAVSSGSVIAGQRKSMRSPDGSVTALTIGRIALTSDSAMPVSRGPFPPHKKLSQSMPNGPALPVAAVPSTAAIAAANTSAFMAVSWVRSWRGVATRHNGSMPWRRGRPNVTSITFPVSRRSRSRRRAHFFTGSGSVHRRKIFRCLTGLRPPTCGPMSRTAVAARLPLDEPIVRPSFRRERAAMRRGVMPVAGCDEAGRGPLAGPVVAAAVILDPGRIPKGLDDSKKLLPEQREKLYAKICATAEVAIAFGCTARIDRDNILQASLWALARAVSALPRKPQLVFVDGRDRIKIDCECQAVIGGDALVLSIAAASIVAKVTRDRLMTQLGLAHPGYGFERHMGYSVPEHFAALERLGPTIHHRRSFAPVAACFGDPAAELDPVVPLPLQSP